MVIFDAEGMPDESSQFTQYGPAIIQALERSVTFPWKKKKSFLTSFCLLKVSEKADQNFVMSITNFFSMSFTPLGMI